MRFFLGYRMTLAGCVFIILWVLAINLSAQSISPFDRINRISKEPSFRVGGYFSTQIMSNVQNGFLRNSDPFNFRLNSSLSIESHGIRSQLSFHFADGNRIYRITRPNISLPSYAFVGLSPSYKWATLHLGTRSMSFSKYTLADHSFQGLGMELRPGSWRVAAMYGRLRRAQVQDFNEAQSLESGFRRRGFGIKAGYQGKGESLHLIYFSAFEDDHSEQVDSFPSFRTPGENQIISINGQKKIGPVILLEVDYALSAFSRDRRQDKIENLSGISLWNRIGGIFTPRLSSSFQKALFTKLTINTGFGSIRLSHERVDPEYRTMGALFFNNDFENLSLGAQWKNQKNTLTMHGDLGIQRNNLSGKESNQMHRFIASLFLSYQVSQAFRLSSQMSNFRTTQKLRISNLPFLEADSLALSLLNQHFSITASYLPSDQSQQVTSVFQYQRASSIQNDEINDDQSFSNLLLQIQYRKRLLSHTNGYLQFQYSRNDGTIGKASTWATTLGWQQTILEGKFRSDLAASLFRTFQLLQESHIFQPRLNVQYLPHPTQNLSLNMLWWKRSSFNNLQASSELTTRIEWKVRF